MGEVNLFEDDFWRIFLILWHWHQFIIYILFDAWQPTVFLTSLVYLFCVFLFHSVFVIIFISFSIKKLQKKTCHLLFSPSNETTTKFLLHNLLLLLLLSMVYVYANASMWLGFFLFLAIFSASLLLYAILWDDSCFRKSVFIVCGWTRCFFFISSSSFLVFLLSTLQLKIQFSLAGTYAVFEFVWWLHTILFCVCYLSLVSWIHLKPNVCRSHRTSTLSPYISILYLQILHRAYTGRVSFKSYQKNAIQLSANKSKVRAK